MSVGRVMKSYSRFLLLCAILFAAAPAYAAELMMFEQGAVHGAQHSTARLHPLTPRAKRACAHR